MKREWIDKMLRSAIRLAMLTGVTFVVTACYGPPMRPDRYEPDPPQPQEGEQVVQQLLNQDLPSEDAAEDK